MSQPISVRPFEQQGHFTTMHNLLLDVVMPRVSDSAWKVLCFIVRHTVGYQRRSEEISYSDIIAGTGIASRATISKALAELLNEEHGKGKYLRLGNAFHSPILLKCPGKGPHDATRYALNQRFELSLRRGRWGSASDDFSGSKSEPQAQSSSSKSEPSSGSKCEPLSAPAYKERARDKERIKKVLTPAEEKSGGGGVSLAEAEARHEPPPPPPRASDDSFTSSHPKSNSTRLEPYPADEVARALCEICGVDASRPSPVDRDRWAGALERVRAIAEQHAVDRDALLAFRAWWFATPTASGARRQSLYLSNVATHLGQFLQARQAAADHDSGAAVVPLAETPRERKRRERMEIEQRAEARRAARQAEARAAAQDAARAAEATGPGGAQ